jgi:hypothetical protein
LIAVEIERKNPDQIGFAVNPRRWVVERFFAWIGRNRRLAKDFEATIDSARAFLYAASGHAPRASDRSCFMTFETDSLAKGTTKAPHALSTNYNPYCTTQLIGEDCRHGRGVLHEEESRRKETTRT